MPLCKSSALRPPPRQRQLQPKPFRPPGSGSASSPCWDSTIEPRGEQAGHRGGQGAAFSGPKTISTRSPHALRRAVQVAAPPRHAGPARRKWTSRARRSADHCPLDPATGFRPAAARCSADASAGIAGSSGEPLRRAAHRHRSCARGFLRTGGEKSSGSSRIPVMQPADLLLHGLRVLQAAAVQRRALRSAPRPRRCSPAAG
jgi:hypothetical protein